MLLPVVVVVVVVVAAAAILLLLLLLLKTTIKDGWDLSEIHCKSCLVWNGDTHISKQDRKCKYV